MMPMQPMDEPLVLGFAPHRRPSPHVQLSQPGADGQYQIGLAVGHNSGKAGGMEAKRMLIADNPPRSYGIGNRTAKVFGQLPHLVTGGRPLGPVAAMNVHQVGVHQQPGRPFDGIRIVSGRLRYPVLLGLPDLNLAVIATLAQDILRD